MRVINQELYQKSLDVAKGTLNLVDSAPYEVKTFGLTLALALLIAENNHTPETRQASVENIKALVDNLLVTMQ